MADKYTEGDTSDILYEKAILSIADIFLHEDPKKKSVEKRKICIANAINAHRRKLNSDKKYREKIMLLDVNTINDSEELNRYRVDARQVMVAGKQKIQGDYLADTPSTIALLLQKLDL